VPRDPVPPLWTLAPFPARGPLRLMAAPPWGVGLPGSLSPRPRARASPLLTSVRGPLLGPFPGLPLSTYGDPLPACSATVFPPLLGHCRAALLSPPVIPRLPSSLLGRLPPFGLLPCSPACSPPPVSPPPPPAPSGVPVLSRPSRPPSLAGVVAHAAPPPAPPLPRAALWLLYLSGPGSLVGLRHHLSRTPRPTPGDPVLPLCGPAFAPLFNSFPFYPPQPPTIFCISHLCCSWPTHSGIADAPRYLFVASPPVPPPSAVVLSAVLAPARARPPPVWLLDTPPPPPGCCVLHPFGGYGPGPMAHAALPSLQTPYCRGAGVGVILIQAPGACVFGRARAAPWAPLMTYSYPRPDYRPRSFLPTPGGSETPRCEPAVPGRVPTTHPRTPRFPPTPVPVPPGGHFFRNIIILGLRRPSVHRSSRLPLVRRTSYRLISWVAQAVVTQNPSPPAIQPPPPRRKRSSKTL